MANLKTWILSEAEGAPIEAVVIGIRGYDFELKQKVTDTISWEAAAPLLDYEFDDGYGSPRCHAIYAWTSTKVIFVHEYDGSTSIASVPRNPIRCIPELI